MNQIPERDPFLDKLLRQSTVFEPSADFTQRIMGIIQQSEEATIVNKSFFLRYSYWLIAACILVLLIATSIFFPSFIGLPQIQLLQNLYKPNATALNGIFSLLKTQPLIPIIIFALTGLLLIDKLLSRLFHPTVQQM